ncbi:hypothetical protein KKC32_03495 [Patescibacteria group bacterium]|nr:hypothetical protein [Patescibacteria group bacterium]
MLEEKLKKIGLSEKEIKVYLASMELGMATVQDISRKSGINRATTYIQLESLLKQGLVSRVEKSNKTMFMAERPQRILDILSERKNKIETLEQTFSRLMPDLEAIYNAKFDKPRVRFFEGEAGLALWRNDLIKSHPDTVCTISPKLEQAEEDEVFSRIIKNLNFLKVIYMSEKNMVLPTAFKARNSAWRFFKLNDFEIEIILYSNKVFINKPVGTDLSMGVLIEDKMVYGSFLSLFDLLWQMSQEFLSAK